MTEYDEATRQLHAALDQMEREVAPAAAAALESGAKFIRTANVAKQSARKISNPAMPAVKPTSK